MKLRVQTRNPSRIGETFEEILSRRIARRSVLKGALFTAPLMVVAPSLLTPWRSEGNGPDGLRFRAISLDHEDRLLIADGYESQILIRWGDRLFRGAPEFDVNVQTPAQAR